MSTLEEQIKEVQVTREVLMRLVTIKAGLVMDFETRNRDVFNALSVAKEECTKAEQTLRDLTLQAYQETGNKAPAPGVDVRIITKLIYDAGEALEWAKQHVLALKLDTPVFEKIAKASKLDFVEMREEPQATIATDLSKVLKED